MLKTLVIFSEKLKQIISIQLDLENLMTLK